MLKKFLLLCLVCLVLFACDKTTEPEDTITTPSFNPPAGTYFSPQSVRIDCTIPGVTIYYTLDGTEPSETSLLYSNPLNVNQGTTIKAKAYRSKMKPSAIATGIYSFAVGTMYITPAGGSYTTPQTVTITPVTQNTVIHYTTDGTDPTETSAVYTQPLVIDGNTVLKAKGFIQGWNSSDTVTQNYVFNVASPTISMPGGTYYTPITVTMSTPTQGAAVHYTTDGSEPAESSPMYATAITIDANTNLKLKAFKTGWNASPTVSAAYIMKAVAPNFTPNPGTFFDDQYVAITTTTPEAEIRYTKDGGEPSLSSALYTGPVLIDGTTTLKARAFRDGWTGSNVTTGTYTIKVNAPTFNPPQGSYSGPQYIAMASATPGAEIRYTLNGSTPTQNSTVYTAPVLVSTNSVIQAIAFKPGLTPSSISVGNFLITNTVATPVFNPSPDSLYNGPIEVTLECATPGASIYYTLDHTPPSIISTFYYYPIQITQDTEVRAIAIKDGWTPSPVAIAWYQVNTNVATPTFSPDPSVIYYEPQLVTIACTTPDATIRYTTNGTDPTATSPEYTDPITISTTTEIRAKAYRTGWTASSVASAMYQVESNNQIYGWGLNEDGQCNVPIGTGFLQIDAGGSHTVALRSNGSLAAWGDNSSQQCNFPPGNNYVAVSAGGSHSLALKADGTVVAWGDNTDGQCTVPPPVGYTYQGISAGGNFSLALTSNNKIVAWGSNDDNQCTVPIDSTFTKVAAGFSHGLGLKSDGSMVAWGNNNSGQLNAPADNGYTDISAGDQHCLAKRTNGTIVAWGSNSNGQATAPTGSNYSTFSAGSRHNIALRTDGSIFTWGYGGDGLSTVPGGTGFIEVSAGGDFSVALKAATRLKGNNNLRYLKPKFKLK